MPLTVVPVEPFTKTFLKFPLGARKNPNTSSSVSYDPATTPFALMADGKVPNVALGASKSVTVPSDVRTKPWVLPDASLQVPVTVFFALRPAGDVPTAPD